MWVEVERGDHPGLRCRRVIIENPGVGVLGSGACWPAQATAVFVAEAGWSPALWR